jgi:hypothetical protein
MQTNDITGGGVPAYAEDQCFHLKAIDLPGIVRHSAT